MSFSFNFFKKSNDGVNEQLSEEVRQAWQRWQNAVAYFNSVTEPDLVECAIYDVEATRKHYMYLVKNLKQKNRSKNVQNVSSAITTIREISDKKYEQGERKWG